jgi:hypothetical protein
MSAPEPEKLEIQHVDKEHDHPDLNLTAATTTDDHISPDAIGRSNFNPPEKGNFGILVLTQSRAGGTAEDLPHGYYRSYKFIGTLLVS